TESRVVRTLPGSRRARRRRPGSAASTGRLLRDGRLGRDEAMVAPVDRVAGTVHCAAKKMAEAATTRQPAMANDVAEHVEELGCGDPGQSVGRERVAAPYLLNEPCA